MKDLDADTKLLLLRFVCSFAWADLNVHPLERKMVRTLLEKMQIDDPEQRRRVDGWLKLPPLAEDVDPMQIPIDKRELFIEQCKAMIRADGVIHPDEAEAIDLLERILCRR